MVEIYACIQSDLSIAERFHSHELHLSNKTRFPNSSKAMNVIRSFLKHNKILSSVYKKIAHSKEPENQWCRVVMDRSTEELISGLDYKNFSTLEISGTKWRDFGFKEYTSVFYPELDLCQNTLNEKFDLIIAEQVFEHLQKPYRAGLNVFEMLNANGHFLLTTPFLIKIHPTPDDCTRCHKRALNTFLRSAGLK